jgi:preprotein translocase subunit YajC
MQDQLDASTIIVRTAVLVVIGLIFFFVLKSDKKKEDK